MCAIKFLFLLARDYETAASFFTTACSDIEPLPGTMKLHAVFPHEPNKIWLYILFGSLLLQWLVQTNSAFEGWHLVNLKENDVECTGCQSK